MRILTPTKWIAPRFAVLVILSTQVFGQETPERFWVAGRYDGNRVVVYFNKVRFEGTMSSKARQIAPPVSDLFFSPVELPASYLAGLQDKPNAEHFAIGDRYDLMLGNGTIATIELTTLVGCETDEGVGNDSFVGAIGTLEQPNALVFTKGYYAVRRHLESKSGTGKPRAKTTAEYRQYAALTDAPIRLRHPEPDGSVARSTNETEATDSEQHAWQMASHQH